MHTVLGIFHVCSFNSPNNLTPIWILSLAPLCNEGNQGTQILKVMLPGSVGTKPRHCPATVDLFHYCSILGKHQNSQLLRILDPPGKWEGSDLRSKALKMSFSLIPASLDSQIHDSLGQNSSCIGWSSRSLGQFAVGSYLFPGNYGLNGTQSQHCLANIFISFKK